MTTAALVNTESAGADDPLKYQLTMFAPSVVDAVSRSGGWIFDRVMAGWDVNVLVPGLTDARPLAVLGATGLELTEAGCSTGALRGAHALAVGAEIFGTDEQIDQTVRTLLRAGTEVTFWGSASPVGVDRPISVVEYPLTGAAFAFKRHALATAGAGTGAAGRTERFFAGR